MHPGARSDCTADDFSFAVKHMTGAVQNVVTSALIVDNESFPRLIPRCLAPFHHREWTRSRYRNSLLSRSGLRTLSEGQRRDKGAAGDTHDYFFHLHYSSV